MVPENFAFAKYFYFFVGICEHSLFFAKTCGTVHISPTQPRNAMFNFFTPSAKKVRTDLLSQAEINLLTHRQLAEYHQAMYTMLSRRVSVLRAEVSAQKEVDREDAEVVK